MDGGDEVKFRDTDTGDGSSAEELFLPVSVRPLLMDYIPLLP